MTFKLKPSGCIMGEILGFVPIYQTEPGSLVTAAFVLCSLCHQPIRAMGGPLTRAMCIDCTENAIKEINDGDQDG